MYSSTYTCTEINAPDLAVGDVGGAGVVAEGNDGDAIFGSVHRHAEDADYVDLSWPISHAHACMSL